MEPLAAHLRGLTDGGPDLAFYEFSRTTGVRTMKNQITAYDLRTAEAVLLLEAPRREAPDVCDTSRATFSYALILAIPVALIVAGFALLTRLTPALPAVSTLVLGR